MAKKTSTRSLYSKVYTVLYLLLITAQLYIAYNAWKLTRLHQHMAQDSQTINYLYYSQPLIWLFSILTVLIFISQIRNKENSFFNMTLIYITMIVSTVFIQVFVMLAGYIPILELNAG